MSEEKIDYLIALQRASIDAMERIIESNARVESVVVQNNMLLQSILSRFDDPKEDMKDIVLDIVGNLAAYNMVRGGKG